MSMHLAGPGLTTTSYKKRETKLTKAKLAELEQGWRERNVRLKEMKLPKETFEQYMDWVHGRTKKEKRPSTVGAKYSTPAAFVDVREEAKVSKASQNAQVDASGQNKSAVETDTHGKKWVTGACASKPSQTYTGSKIIGIATMHKSNMVPVFSDEQAVDISRMRR